MRRRNGRTGEFERLNALLSRAAADNAIEAAQRGLAESMTYCGGILVKEGLVMFADTRTNFGVDNISTFRRLHVFRDPKKRVMAIASAGNLSTRSWASACGYS